MKILQRLFGKQKLKEPTIEQLNKPYVMVSCSDGDKMKVKINGVWFWDDEKIHAKYLGSDWGTVTLVYRPWANESTNGWSVLDYWCDRRALNAMDCIGKMSDGTN